VSGGLARTVTGGKWCRGRFRRGYRGVEDADDAERRRLKDVGGGSVSIMSMVSRLSVMLEGMPGEMGGHDHVFYVDPEPWRRRRDTRRRKTSGSDAKVLRTMLTRISEASGISTTPKGAGWKV